MLIGINMKKETDENEIVQRVRLKKIMNKYLVLDILCYSHRTSRYF
jgi:hypothetical protein